MQSRFDVALPADRTAVSVSRRAESSRSPWDFAIPTSRAGLSGLEVSLREKPPPERGERGDSVLTVFRRVVAAAEFVEQVCPVGRHQ